MDAEELPPGWTWATLDNFVRDRGVSVDPARWPEKRFTLYSVPAHALGKPEILYGKDIGSTKQAIVPGTVLLSKINPRINRVWITADHGPNASLLGSTEWITFPPSAQVNADYLKFFLMRENVRRYLTENVSGVGGSLMRVNTEVVGKIEMPVAPASEQLRIAAAVNTLFEELDEAEAALARAREGVEQFRASLLHAACTGQLTAAWREANPPTETGADLLRRILAERRATWERTERARLEAKGTPPRGDAWKARYVEPTAPDLTGMPDLPEGWAWASLGQLTTKITSGSRDWGDHYADDGAILVRAQNIKTDNLVTDNLAHVRPPGNLGESRTGVLSHDLLITITGANVTKSALVDVDLGEAYVSQHVGLCRPVLASTARFVHLTVICGSFGRKQLTDAAYGAGKPGLNLQDLARVRIPLPPRSEQNYIVNALDETIQATCMPVDVQSSSAAPIAMLRQSILHAAFTGKLVPQDPADEPASALLARLRNTVSTSRRARGRNATKVPA